jgi:hypothetical protein
MLGTVVAESYNRSHNAGSALSVTALDCLVVATVPPIAPQLLTMLPSAVMILLGLACTVRMLAAALLPAAATIVALLSDSEARAERALRVLEVLNRRDQRQKGRQESPGTPAE